MRKMLLRIMAKSSIYTSHSAFRYAVLGASSFINTIAITAISHEIIGLSEPTSYLIALVSVFFMNFAGMRYYVFVGTSQSALPQSVTFLMTSIGFRLLEYSAFLLLHTFLDLHYIIAIIMVQIVSFLTKYIVYRLYVFG
jgi:putative flippase GtrA